MPLLTSRLQRSALFFGSVIFSVELSVPLLRAQTLYATPFYFTTLAGDGNQGTRDPAPSTAPTITSNPASRSVLVGTNVSLAVGVTGTPRTSIRWLKDGNVFS